MVRVKKIGVKQTAKFAAVFYLTITAIFFIPFALISLLVGALSEAGSLGLFPGVFMVFMPFVYAGIGFLMVAIMSVLYNFVAKRVGGVEIEIEKSESPLSALPEQQRSNMGSSMGEGA